MPWELKDAVTHATFCLLGHAEAAAIVVVSDFREGYLREGVAALHADATDVGVLTGVAAAMLDRSFPFACSRCC